MAENLMKSPCSIVIPIRNDYQSATILVNQISKALSESDNSTLEKIVLVDDGSDASEEPLKRVLLERGDVIIVDLNKHLGHQKAIHRGLQYVHHNFPESDVVIMDGDGEDKPEDIVKLIEVSKGTEKANLVIAQRGGRDVTKTFSLGYLLYQTLFRILVGKKMNTGNFSWINSKYLATVLSFPELHLNISASLWRFGTEIRTIKLDRGKRIQGKSKMNLSRLVLHGYGALAVYFDIAFSRIIIAISAFGVGVIVLTVLLIVAKLAGIYHVAPGILTLVFFEVFSTLAVLFTVTFFSLILLLRINSKNEQQGAKS